MTAVLRHISLAVCLVAWLAAGCRKKPAEVHFHLDNGLRVDLFATTQGDRAALALLFEVGADHDPPGRSGMAHLAGRLFATCGVAGRSAPAIAPNAQTAQTGAGYTSYAVEVPAGQLMEELGAAATRMSSLTVTQADLERERTRLLADLATAQEHDPVSAAMTRAAEAVRPSRGDGLRGGVATQVEKITVDEVEAFRRAAYGASTARLIVAGHFSVDEASKQIRARFGTIPAGQAPPARAPSGARVAGTLVMGDAPGAVALAVPVPETKDPLYPAFLLLAARVIDAGAGEASPARVAAHSWKGDFAPLSRPDILFVTSLLPAGEPPEAFAARVRAEVSAVVGAPLGAGEAAQVVAKLGGPLGMTPLPAATYARAPSESAFAAGRREQLGIDGAALARGAQAITQEQVTAAARLFDDQSSAAVIAGGKI